MKARKKSAPSTSIKRNLIQTSAGVLVFGFIGLIIFLYQNDKVNNNSMSAAMMFAGSSYSSNRTGNWSTASTWNGGTAPSTSLNGDNITVNNGHSVSLVSSLGVQNNSTFVINGTLTIHGDLDVQNNLLLTISGSLIVNGKITVLNNSAITVNGGGNLTSTGDLAINNNANVTINGAMNIGGNLSYGSNATFRGNGAVSITGSSCNQWTGPGTCSDNTTLPIELLSFIAENSNEGIVLTWKTATELNNDHFNIERSADGINYSVIAELNGSGTTKKITEYKFTDSKTIAGLMYYRLSQTDFDGKSETFKPVAIEAIASSEKQVVTVYPNPIVGKTLTVNFLKPEKGTVEFIDSKGDKLISQAIDGLSDNIQLSIDGTIHSGICYVNFTSTTSKETVKLMKNQ